MCLPARIESEIVHDGPRHQFGDSCFLRHLSTRGASLLVEMLGGIRMHVEHHHVHLTEYGRYKYARQQSALGSTSWLLLQLYPRWHEK